MFQRQKRQDSIFCVMLKFAKSDRVRQSEGSCIEEIGHMEPAKKAKVKQLEVPPNPQGETSELATLFNQFENLKKSHDDFEKFLGVVLSDLTDKKEHLKRIKDCEKSKRNDKSFASVQLFMIAQYNSRISR